MQAGMDELMGMSHLVRLIDTMVEPAKPRGLYKSAVLLSALCNARGARSRAPHVATLGRLAVIFNSLLKFAKDRSYRLKILVHRLGKV
jgi:hypothetical protein